jgi:hypothetical protein
MPRARRHANCRFTKRCFTSVTFVNVGVRTIAEHINPGVPTEATIATLKLSTGGDPTKNDASLSAVEPEIAKKFGEAFAAMSTPLRLPVHVLLIAPAELSEWFSQFLTRIDFAPFTLTAQPFETQIASFIDKDTKEMHADMELALALGLLRMEKE